MTITLSVQGMTCNHCKMSITNALTELEGVQNVEVHLQEGTVNVEYNDSKVDIEKMKEVIEDQGYDVK
ncbi:copper chaperone CopZ [Bacillus cereus]|uniref:copper chaperone CopZ n=1 Tax=Bacillus cereus TaxID=1396 RepID=UPI0039C48914